MTRIPHSWQGLGLLLGLALIVPLISGQGCMPQPPGTSDLNTAPENTSGQSNNVGDPNALATPPLVQILFPNGGEQVESGTIVAVRVFARHNSIPDPTLRVFYDQDTNSTNGNTTIATIKTSSGGTGWNTAGVPQGKYYIGSEMVGVTPAVADYSDAVFDLVPAGTSTGTGSGSGSGSGSGTPPDPQASISAPRSAVSLFEGAIYSIRWSTNLQPGQGTAVVFREADLDKDGIPDGAGLRNTIGTPGIDAASQKLDFNTDGVIGTFFIGITVTTTDGKTVTAYSTGTLNISAPVFWVGDLATKRDKNNQIIPQSGPFKGAVLKGANFQDNLGSAMIPADDFDGDGVNDIVLAAQFAKPFFFASEGRGAGEAYLIYGNTNRMSGDYNVNNTGQPTMPGVLFTGILPNPHGNADIDGNKFAFRPDPPYLPTTGYETEGLRSLTAIPDQDGDGKQELVFGFPWCDSYSLANMIGDGIHPAPVNGEGRLENDGHFLRGGLVTVSSRNPLINSQTALSRHLDRTMMLQQVGQIFSPGTYATGDSYKDLCPNLALGGFPAKDTAIYPFDGFWQSTGGGSTGPRIDPPRLADPQPALGLALPSDCVSPVHIDINQVDSPPIPTGDYFYGRYPGMDAFVDNKYPQVDPDYCDLASNSFPLDQLGRMPILGSGFYVTMTYATDANPANNISTQRFSDPREPYGCRILGQTTTQLNTSPQTTANRFGASVSVSNDFLVVGAPLRTALTKDVSRLPVDRYESGEVYLLQLRRPGTPATEIPWRYQTSMAADPANPNAVPKSLQNYSAAIPQPHNYIIDDVGYTRYLDPEWNETRCGWVRSVGPGDVAWEMNHPIRIVGEANDRIGDSVAGLRDINFDGVDDVAVGGPGTNDKKGAVYVIYRRQPEVEGDYLLDEFKKDPYTDPNRLNGLMIIGEQGEQLGSSIAGPGPAALKDDYNDDGFSDALIGSPNAITANGYESGKVFILFGGKNLVNPIAGVTIPELVTSGDGVVLLGAEADDRAGETVSCAGDVNNDGIPDFLIAAPKATVPDIQFNKPGTALYQSLRVAMTYDSNGDGIVDTPGIGIDRDGNGKADALNPEDLLDTNGNIIYTAADDLTDAGVVYLVYGGSHLKGTISLSEIGSTALPGCIFVGRAAGNELGGGHTQNDLLAKGLAYAGDLDGDGKGDLMISSILADPDGKTNAGEVYVVYGFAP